MANIAKFLPKFVAMDAPKVKLVPPQEGTILLHACCAPCSSAVLECLKDNGLESIVFYSNSNIYPEEEYIKRREELRKYCDKMGVQLICDEYNHQDWLQNVAHGLENEKEKGPRCLKCFEYRLSRAVEYARLHGLNILTTTLASSRWKLLSQVNQAGSEACKDSGVIWWDQDWRKGGLQPRRDFLIKELGFYNQLWCGCEFSMRKQFEGQNVKM